MREIVSPLSGIRSPFGQLTSPLAIYAVLGIKPQLVLDFDDEKYFANSARSTFSGGITHSRAGNATMVDSDGLLKWAPHNLITYSGDLTGDDWEVSGTASIVDSETISFLTDDSSRLANNANTASAGPEHTVQFEYISDGTFEVVARGAGVTQALNTASASAVETTHTLIIPAGSSAVNRLWIRRGSGFTATQVTIRNVRVYRSDLGGMVNNPDTGDSYVPTTSSAVYLPRRGHHVYNGSAWVNEGLLHESEARTNSLIYSEDFTNAAWFALNTATLAVDATGPDGETSAVTLADSGATGSGAVSLTETVTVATSTAYTFSLFAKANQLSWVSLQARNFTTPSDGQVFFNLSTGTVGATDAGYTASVQDFGNGWYRCSITFTTDASDTSGALDIRAATGDNNAACDLDGTSSILVYGAQFEAGSTPSSYIPNAGAPSGATRAAETLTVPAANLPWSSSAVSIQMDGLETFADEGSATQETLFDWQVDSNNRITLALDTDSAKVGTLTLTMVNGSGTDETISTTAELTPGVNDPFNVAIVCTSNEIGIALDGTAETRVSHSIGLPDLSGADATLGGNGTRALLRAWNQDITNAGQEEAST